MGLKNIISWILVALVALFTALALFGLTAAQGPLEFRISSIDIFSLLFPMMMILFLIVPIAIIYFFIYYLPTRSKSIGSLDKELLSQFDKAVSSTRGSLKDALPQLSDLSAPTEYRGMSGIYSNMRLDFFMHSSLAERLGGFWGSVLGEMLEMIVKGFQVFNMSVRTKPGALCFIRGGIGLNFEVGHAAMRFKSADLDLSGETGSSPGMLKISDNGRHVCTIDIPNRKVLDSKGERIGSFELPIRLRRIAGIQMEVSIPVKFDSTTYNIRRIPGAQSLKDTSRISNLYGKEVDGLDRTRKIALLGLTALVFLIYKG